MGLTFNSIVVHFGFSDSVKGCPECDKYFTDISSPFCNTSALKGIVTKTDKEGRTHTRNGTGKDPTVRYYLLGLAFLLSLTKTAAEFNLLLFVYNFLSTYLI